MDSRTDFQRLLEEMDRAIRRKQQELTELDERLETARLQLSDKEAKELLVQQQNQESGIDYEVNSGNKDLIRQQDIDELVQEQRQYYERQVAALNEELAEYEHTSRSLMKSNDQFRAEVELLRVSNKKLKDRMHTLNENLEEVQNANFELNIRLAKAESESQMQHKLLEKSHVQDQILMNAFNNKLESLKAGIASRDEEIRRLRSDNQLTLESLGVKLDYHDEMGQVDGINGRGKDTNGDAGLESINNSNKSGKQIMTQILHLIKVKDERICRLNDQLQHATKELETNAKLLKTLTSEPSSNSQKANEVESTHYADSESELVLKNKMMEVELIEKDKQLHLIEKRNHHFESILPKKIIDLIEDLRSKCKTISDLACVDQLQGVGESDKIRAKIESLIKNLDRLWVELDSSQRLLDTIDQLQRIVVSRDEHIRRLVIELNEMDAKINQDTVDEHQTDERRKIRPSESRAARANDLTRQDQDKFLIADSDNKSITEAEQQAETATDSKSEQQQSAHFKPKQKDGCFQFETTLQNAAEASESPCPSLTATDLVRGLNTRKPTKSIGFDKSKQRVSISRHHFGRRRYISSSTKRTIDWHNKRTSTKIPLGKKSSKIEQALNYRNRLRQLENENQLLELAMKEILLSIKWSDTKCSTILIDCPSLERLCHLIEARYIAKGSNRCRINSGQSQVGGCEQLVDVLSASNLCSVPTDMPSSERQNYSDCDIFQIVVLKSELDLLRGQNEQLRSDLKLQRSDWHHHLRNKDKIGESHTSEAEIQTDSPDVIDIHGQTSNQQVLNANPNQQEDSCSIRKLRDKCKNCARLVRLANHLLDCIVRIESRVNSSDESYICKLLTLYQLTQRLSQDLSFRDNLIEQLRRDFHAISQQKLISENRVYFLEGHIEMHKRICPMDYYAPTSKIHSEREEQPTNVQMYATTKNGNTESVHSLTIRRNQKQVELPLRDSRITIALLQSIIGCLQARLDYKDKRLDQLEQMLIGA